MSSFLNPASGDRLTDDQAMDLALSESQKGAGFVSPNPMVGCVILDSQNRFLAKGFHQNFGGPHAEVNALQTISSSEELKQARVFVTLEPCAHEGKTPSCAKALAKLPLKEVIYGLQDPNPLVSGQGLKILTDAGITVTPYLKRQEDFEQSCEHFLMNFRKQKPFVSLKVASSLDGQLGLKSGESKWITGVSARQYAHYLRATHDAILVGKNTILTDDPALNIRHPSFINKKNKVIILDAEGKCLKRPELKVFKSHKPENIFVVVKKGIEKSNLAQIIEVPTYDPHQLNIKDLLTKIWHLGIKSILVEGGAQTLSSFISHFQADRLYLFQAPILLGGKSGKGWSEGVIIDSMTSRIQLKHLKVQSLDPDLLITGRLS